MVCRVSLYRYQVLPLSESTMAANGDGEEKGAEHPSAMSLFAPATQAAVSFHITCLVFVNWCFEPLRRN